jgi:hypothetical protein
VKDIDGRRRQSVIDTYRRTHDVPSPDSTLRLRENAVTITSKRISFCCPPRNGIMALRHDPWKDLSAPEGSA